MRLFVALNFNAREQGRIFKAAGPLRDIGLPVRWVDSGNYHITLKFLGDVHPEALPKVEQTLDEVAASTTGFSIDLGGFGAFPTIRRPKVFWLGVDASPALRCLKQDIEWALADHGFERETRAFHPHLTLGRTVSDDGAGAFRGLDEIAAGLSYRGTITVRTVDLMRSHLTRGEPRYQVLRSSALKSSPGR